jgi:hypothetical protein
LEINTNAPVLVRKEILVEALIGKIWGLLADVNQWKYWQPEVSDPVLERPFAKGSVIRYKALYQSLALTLLEVVPPRHLAWTGESSGLVLTTIWNLEETPEGTRVKADSTWEGFSAINGWLLKITSDIVLKDCLKKFKQASEIIS